MSDVKSSTVRRLALELAVGLAVGFLLANLLGPAVVSRSYGTLSGNGLSCADSVAEALHQFVMLQLICAGIGALGLVVVLVFARRFLRNRKKPTSAV